jgi:putative sterol carrier protein
MDIEEFFSNVEKAFKPEAAVDVDAVYQFNISGDGGGEWAATIKDGTCTVKRGIADSPGCTVVTDVETWTGIMDRQLSAMDAFMSGKLRIKGDMALAMKLQSMFLT